MDTITAPLRGIISDLHDHAEDKADEATHHAGKVIEHNDMRKAAEGEHEKAKVVAANIISLIGIES